MLHISMNWIDKVFMCTMNVVHVYVIYIILHKILETCRLNFVVTHLLTDILSGVIYGVAYFYVLDR